MGGGRRGVPSKFLAIKPVSGPAPHLHVLVTWQSYVCYTRLSHYRSHSFQKADLKCSVLYNKYPYLWIPRSPTGCESLNFRTLVSCQMAVMWCRRGLWCSGSSGITYFLVIVEAKLWRHFVKYWLRIRFWSCDRKYTTVNAVIILCLRSRLPSKGKQEIRSFILLFWGGSKSQTPALKKKVGPFCTNLKKMMLKIATITHLFVRIRMCCENCTL